MASDANAALAAQMRDELLDRKVRFGMPEHERRRLMDVLLDLHRAAMATFDALEADLVSGRDVMVMASIPELCNEVTRTIERHARARMGASR